MLMLRLRILTLEVTYMVSTCKTLLQPSLLNLNLQTELPSFLNEGFGVQQFWDYHTSVLDSSRSEHVRTHRGGGASQVGGCV